MDSFDSGVLVEGNHIAGAMNQLVDRKEESILLEGIHKHSLGDNEGVLLVEERILVSLVVVVAVRSLVVADDYNLHALGVGEDAFAVDLQEGGHMVNTAAAEDTHAVVWVENLAWWTLFWCGS